jgi:hypothetical protein
MARPCTDKSVCATSVLLVGHRSAYGSDKAVILVVSALVPRRSGVAGGAGMRAVATGFSRWTRSPQYCEPAFRGRQTRPRGTGSVRLVTSSGNSVLSPATRAGNMGNSAPPAEAGGYWSYAGFAGGPPPQGGGGKASPRLMPKATQALDINLPPPLKCYLCSRSKVLPMFQVAHRQADEGAFHACVSCARDSCLQAAGQWCKIVHVAYTPPCSEDRFWMGGCEGTRRLYVQV